MSDASIENRLLIRELYGRYAISAARQDVQTWLDCWSEDATWKTPHFEVSGQAALRASWDATWSNFSNVAAYNEVGDIAVSGDTASTVTAVLEFIDLAAGGTLRMSGLYTDDLVLENGAWRFARREYTLLNQEGGAPA